jgi:diguanylate cyclase (GGDEF)-like protein/PAS domain S-box-containing protein
MDSKTIPLNIAEPKQMLSDRDEVHIKQIALKALRSGDFDFALKALQRGEASVPEMVEDLKIYQAELEVQNEELRQSQLFTENAVRRFSNLFASLPIPALMIDEMGVVFECNEMAMQRFSLERKQLRSQYFPRMVKKQDHGRLRKLINEAKDLGQAMMSNVTLESAEATIFIADLYLALLPEQAENETRFVITIIDQTESITQQNALELSRKLFISYFDAAPAGMAATNLENGWIEVNQKLCDLLGYSQRELLRKTWNELTHPGDIPASIDYFNLLVSRQIDSYNMDKRFIRKDGSILDAHLAVSCLRKSDGSIDYFVSIVEDVSARKQFELELKIAATAFESQEAMAVTDANGLILRVNQAFINVTGYTQAEVLGKNPRILQSGRHGKEFYINMWNSIHSTGTWQGEVWNRRNSGEVYPEYLNITAVKDAGGIVTNYVATFTDITLSKAASEEIKNLAFYDPLTQLPNRRLLIDRLQQAIAASTRSGQRGALLFLDLDHFKTLNDTLGHDIGDLLLQQVAERLAWCVREGDTVARIGGDEFVVLIEGLSEGLFEAAAHAEAVANKILNSLNQVYQLGSHEYYNSPSIGATLFSGHEVEIEELLKHADIAMYDAKKAGRNTLRFFDPVMQEAINVHADMTRELRYAIAQQQFQLYYQIQVDHLGQALGAEALIRWVHPERGIISPFNFIPLAEETGLILPIGLWVLETACAQLKAWEQDAGTRELTISINVSAKQFNQPMFVTQVQKTVQQYAINTSLLKLELTESIIVEKIDHIIITMLALEALGIRFELDDFGTGYSSLQYLKQLPIHQLKIDQSFVRDITSDSSDRTIVRTIIMMANSLGLQVIAEGVETEEQRQTLFDNGCTNYQGYLFAKPVPIDEFEAALRGS